MTVYITLQIKHGFKRSKCFDYGNGVRQGCILSPMFFNLYFNEIPFLLDKQDTDSIILLDGSSLNCLLYARITWYSPLFLMSTTSVVLFRLRFIPLAESENIFRKRILSALSMPSFYRNWIIVIVCFMDCPLVKLRNFRDCRTPRQD